MNLKAKFVISSVLLVAVSLVAAALSLYWMEKKHLKAAQAENIEQTLTRFSRVCQESFIEKSDITLLQYMRTLLESPAIKYAALLDPAGKVLFHTRMFDKDFDIVGQVWDEKSGDVRSPGPRVRHTVVGGDSINEWSVPVTTYGAKKGTALIGFDRNLVDLELSGTLNATLFRFLWVLLAALVVGVLGALALAAHLNAPISQLVEGTRRLAGGDRQSRIHLERKDELGVLAGEFNRMAGRLSELDEMKDHFLSSVTHDLRSPLTAVKGRAELLLGDDSQGLNERQLRNVKMIQQSSDNLEYFVNDILDLTKMEAGKFEVKKDVLDADAVAKEVSENLAILARPYKITLETDIPPGQHKVLADAGHLKRILTNLVSNAIKFTPENGKITIGAAREGGEISMWVQDTGIGIPEDKLKGMFSKFFQVTDKPASVREVSGTGLGLAIAKELVEANGGRIWVESRLNRGSKFTFTLHAK